MGPLPTNPANMDAHVKEGIQKWLYMWNCSEKDRKADAVYLMDYLIKIWRIGGWFSAVRKQVIGRKLMWEVSEVFNKQN